MNKLLFKFLFYKNLFEVFFLISVDRKTFHKEYTQAMTNPTTNLQSRFFQELKSIIPPYSSLVDEIAELLQVSMDSAYRRIRGEKLLDF